MQASRGERRRIQTARMSRNRRDSVFNTTNRAMKSDVTVHLDKSSYVAGDVISGCVCITLTQDVKVKELRARIIGQARVSWDEQRSYTKGSAPSVSRKNTETYLDHSIVLLKKGKVPVSLSINRRQTQALRASPATSMADMTSCTTLGPDTDDGVFIPPGDHNFRFEFALPRTIPATYEGKWGQIKYSAKIILERPWKFDIEREQEFSVRAYTDLNDEPELARPIGALGEFQAGMFCINQGFVNVEVRLSRRGFIPGDKIPCLVEIENNTSHKLYGIRLTLQQHITFRVGKTIRKVTQTLATLSKGEVTSFNTVLWENEIITIPADTPPTTSKNLRSIQIKYTVTLHVTHSSWREEYTLPIVIIMGTEGLRKAVIESYLNMLSCSHDGSGISQSNTPRLGKPVFKINDALPPLSNHNSALSTHLPALMTRDQLSMRRASAYPAMMPTSHPVSQPKRHAHAGGTDSGDPNTAVGNSNCNNRNRHHSSMSSLAYSRQTRRASELALPGGGSISSNDIRIIIDGESELKRKAISKRSQAKTNSLSRISSGSDKLLHVDDINRHKRRSLDSTHVNQVRLNIQGSGDIFDGDHDANARLINSITEMTNRSTLNLDAIKE